MFVKFTFLVFCLLMVYSGTCLSFIQEKKNIHPPNASLEVNNKFFDSSDYISSEKNEKYIEVLRKSTQIPTGKGSLVFSRQHLNESMEKIQFTNNGSILKSTFIPLLPNNSTLEYSPANNKPFDEVIPKSVNDIFQENNRSIAATEPSITKRNFENLNNATVMRNGKKYRIIKVKRNVTNAKIDGQKYQRQTRTFKLIPNIMTMLPVQWMTKKRKTDVSDSELRTDTQVMKENSAKPLGNSLQNSEKIKKLLNLFTIVKFDNGECFSNGMKGVCVHQVECEEKGGKFTETCAGDLGVCCYNEKTCGQRSKENCTYFVNDGFPESSTTAPKVCALTLDKADPNVKQLRLDFLIFQLRDPINGTCLHDRLIVTGQDTNHIVPEICGINTGQHIYVDVEDSDGPYNLNIITMGEYFPRNFQIKVTQIRKDDETLAPKNCLQYFTEPTGTVQTFNYHHNINDNEGEITTGYFNNLNYAICIKKQRGFCSISYENEEVGAFHPTFQLINVDDEGEKLLPPRQAGAETFDCPNDYIVINSIRLCGEKLNDATVEIDFTKNYPVTDTSNGPFILSIRTDSAVSGRGFFLTYRQNPCLL